MKAPPAPTAEALREAALAYLSHRPSSVAQLGRVLSRKIEAWAQKAARAGSDEGDIAYTVTRANEATEAILARFCENGLLNDATFADHRAQRLARAGKSQRAIAADLAQKGIAGDLARAAVPRDASSELTAAIIFTKRKRLGAFARDPGSADEQTRRRWLGAMARAGYSFGTAERALRMDKETAEDLLQRNERAPPGW